MQFLDQEPRPHEQLSVSDYFPSNPPSTPSQALIAPNPPPSLALMASNPPPPPVPQPLSTIYPPFQARPAFTSQPPPPPPPPPQVFANYQDNDWYFNSFPPGYRFCPHDHELVLYYLDKKVKGLPLPMNKIVNADLYQFDPEILSAQYNNNGEKAWYFFTPRSRKYKNGNRPNRAAGGGYWKATGADKPVKYDKPVIGADNAVTKKKILVGYRKALVYYNGRPPKGEKTNWIMHEYRLNDPPPHVRNSRDDMRLDDCVLCRIYKKHDRRTDANANANANANAHADANANANADAYANANANADAHADANANAYADANANANANANAYADADANVRVQQSNEENSLWTIEGNDEDYISEHGYDPNHLSAIEASFAGEIYGMVTNPSENSFPILDELSQQQTDPSGFIDANYFCMVQDSLIPGLEEAFGTPAPMDFITTEDWSYTQMEHRDEFLMSPANCSQYYNIPDQFLNLYPTMPTNLPPNPSPLVNIFPMNTAPPNGSLPPMSTAPLAAPLRPANPASSHPTSEMMNVAPNHPGQPPQHL